MKNFVFLGCSSGETAKVPGFSQQQRKCHFRLRSSIIKMEKEKKKNSKTSTNEKEKMEKEKKKTRKLPRTKKHKLVKSFFDAVEHNLLSVRITSFHDVEFDSHSCSSWVCG